MPIDPDRISRDIEIIASFNEAAPEVGYSRPTFSAAWRKARDYVQHEAEAAGCKIRIDAAGNLHARHASIGWDEKVWLSGSHIDSVPTGGKFDGVIGIVCPLEVLRSAHAAGKVLPLELMIFAEEEGTTFGIGMIGSRLWTGDATAETINSFRNADCSDFFQAGESHGVRAGQLLADRFNASFYRGLVEIHIEQGPSMWERGSPIEIVATIAGRMQFVVELDGTPNHAGSTPMNYRRDALVAAANYILAVEKLAKELGDGTVATVGRIVCEPNAINVIPGFVRFTIDLRGPSTEVLKAGHEALKKINAQHVEGSNARLVITEDQPTVKLSDWVIGGLHRAALGELDITISGALHDAAIIAPLLPTAMLFVASKDGISHNPAEFSRIEDIAAAASVLEKLVADS